MTFTITRKRERERWNSEETFGDDFHFNCQTAGNVKHSNGNPDAQLNTHNMIMFIGAGQRGEQEAKRQKVE